MTAVIIPFPRRQPPEPDGADFVDQINEIRRQLGVSRRAQPKRNATGLVSWASEMCSLQTPCPECQRGRGPFHKPPAA